MGSDIGRNSNFNVRIKIIYNDSTFGPGVARIMELVKETGSLSEAYRIMELSSSKGWKIIKNAEKSLGFPLFNSFKGGKGGGKSVLTADGEDLLNKYKAFVLELNLEAEKLYTKYFG